MIAMRLLLLTIPLLAGCASYKIATTDLPIQDPSTSAARDHWLYDAVPRHRSQIKWYDLTHWVTWALLGNDDDGIFGEEPSAGKHATGEINPARAARWTVRNPLHNLCFYVIGSAERENSEFTLLKLSDEGSECLEYHKKATTTLPGRKIGFFLGLHGGKPFLSLRLDYGRVLDFYIGWRERGNFGVKLNPAKASSSDI
jgi:hypothetical protein